MSHHAQTARTLEHLRSLHIGSDMDTELTSQLARLLKRDDEGELSPSRSALPGPMKRAVS